MQHKMSRISGLQSVAELILICLIEMSPSYQVAQARLPLAKELKETLNVYIFKNSYPYIEFQLYNL